MLFCGTGNADLVTLFSQVANAVSVISNQKCNVNFMYFHTLLYEEKRDWGTTEIPIIKKVDLTFYVVLDLEEL